MLGGETGGGERDIIEPDFARGLECELATEASARQAAETQLAVAIRERDEARNERNTLYVEISTRDNMEIAVEAFRSQRDATLAHVNELEAIGAGPVVTPPRFSTRGLRNNQNRQVRPCNHLP